MTLAIPLKASRIDVRATAPVKLLLQEAARLSHKNVSEFLLEAGVNAAKQTLASQLRFEITEDAWNAFLEALDAPVQPKPKLKKLLTDPGALG